MGLSRKVLMNATYNDGKHEKWTATKTFLSGVNPVEKDGKKTMPGRLFDCPEFGDVTVDSLDETDLEITIDVRDTKPETFNKNMTARIWTKVS